MQPDFTTLKPVVLQPDFASLKPVSTSVTPTIDTSTMPRSRMVVDKSAPGGKSREYLDTTTGKYVSQKDSTFSQRIPAFAETFIDPALRGIASAVRAPVDLVRGLFGKTPLEQKLSLPSGRTDQGTIQSDFATKTVPDVQSGAISPLAATAGVTAESIAAGLDVGGAGAITEKVASTVIPKIASTLSKSVVNTDLRTIADSISPKLTAKELRLAESQGRIIKGKEPTLFKSGTPDKILTSDKVYNATQTIYREIPDAAKMTEPELYTALDARTIDMAEQLKPQMQAVRVQKPAIQKMKTAWKDIKSKQITAADATEEPNVLKLQKQFESRLNKIDSNSTYDDLWQERIALDDSTPTAVKNANSLSDSRLLSKKEIWLQNRAILNNAINDIESGLGETSRKAFADMSNMYNAKTNLLTKANATLEARPAKVLQWIKAHPYKSALIGAGISGAVGGTPRAIIRGVTGL